MEIDGGTESLTALKPTRGVFDPLDSGVQSSVVALVQSTREHLPNADNKIVYDKFHIVRHLTDAVDQVRRRENQALVASGNRCLVGTKYGWLRNPRDETYRQRHIGVVHVHRHRPHARLLLVR